MEQAARTATRDEECFFHKFQEAEISNLHLQLLQLQSDNQRLREDVVMWQRHFDQSEHCKEQMETQQQMMQMMQMMQNMLGGGMLPPMHRSMLNAFSSSQRCFAASAGSSHASGSSSSSGTPTSPSENHAGPSHLQYDALEAGDEPLDENWEPTQQGDM
ncbi:hypothetical protein M422DRAFT_271699 [Sphaerobolus stellatus SS14]|uniref:Uncharacterized protein n=1 Tax=Sphaerobolus stellatus (strain SS14) TaxID=990650 RepID=A0A0C9TD54_SPHS4|nr:hypothetical protein M422DRAFT_271699 [Sphaerobolus stellatus SS14]